MEGLRTKVREVATTDPSYLQHQRGLPRRHCKCQESLGSNHQGSQWGITPLIDDIQDLVKEAAQRLKQLLLNLLIISPGNSGS